MRGLTEARAPGGTPGGRDRRASRVVVYCVVATLLGLSGLLTVSAGLLGRSVAARADREIERLRGVPLTAAPYASAVPLDPAWTALVVDRRGRVVQRRTGSPDLPPFPRLTADRLDAYAGRVHPVTVGSSGEYRALVVRDPGQGGYRIIARATADTRRTVNRLVRLQLAVGGVLLTAVMAGAWGVHRWEVRDRRERERQLREFLATAGHELRNQLTTIAGYTQIAAGGTEAGGEKEAEEDAQAGAGAGAAVGAGAGGAGVEVGAPAAGAATLGGAGTRAGAGAQAETGAQAGAGAGAEAVGEADGAGGPVRAGGRTRRLPVRDGALRRAGTEIRRMTSLIDELVLLSRLDLGQPLQWQRIDLARLCRDVCGAERDCHPEQPIRLLIGPGEHTVHGDPERLRQAVANLLANARLHTPPGTTTTLGLGTEDGNRVIEVVDDGPGVPAELRERIFDRFVRGEGTTVAGSGLGLGVVRAVAAAHGGTATLQPQPHGRGAWFRIRLPAAS
ncbi:sensor histidine kinase [Streptomyces sp. bgisy159]|uniref:sensor histidine kinase n=1 Tax=Streptomyces sp. bgisy159 TaxID=3413795 RepID=UPI003F4A3533